MAAYVLSEIVEILDQALMEKYRSLAPTSIERYGGRYIVRGGAIEKLEGDWMPHAIVIVEFPTMGRAQEWYQSLEYAEALTIRPQALNRRLFFIEGVALRE
jgi:uncharacterized protein (DUF1330 family)